MSQRLEIIGKTFGRLTVERYAGSNSHGQAVWQCRCACGGSKNVLGYLLKRGEVKSCGCLRGKQNRNRDAQIVEKQTPAQEVTNA